jgi:hypothetical protein
MTDPRLGPEQARLLRTPDISFPFPARVHPHADTINEQAIAWILHHGLAPTDDEEQYLRRQRPGRCLAWLCPQGDTACVTLGACLFLWALLLDDRMTNHGGTGSGVAALADHLLSCDRIMRAPNTTLDVHHNPMQAALQDWCRRLRDVASAQQRMRLHGAMTSSFLGFVTEAACTATCCAPTVSQYRLIRQATSSTAVFLVLLEIAAGFETPPHALLEPEIRTLTSLAMDLFTTTNEILTCPRDVHLHDGMNLAIVLARQHRCSVQQGIDLAAYELDRNTTHFRQLAERVRTRPQPWAPRLVSTLEYFVAGHRAWIAETGRYDVPTTDRTRKPSSAQ